MQASEFRYYSDAGLYGQAQAQPQAFAYDQQILGSEQQQQDARASLMGAGPTEPTIPLQPQPTDGQQQIVGMAYPAELYGYDQQIVGAAAPVSFWNRSFCVSECWIVVFDFMQCFVE